MVMKYDCFGDIKLGLCDDSEKELLYQYIESHKDVYIKKTEEDEYYLCVPICIGSNLDNYDSNIYIDPTICNQFFYFVDLCIPENIAFINYDEKNLEYISNIDIEGCLQKEELFFNEIQYEKALYEILPCKIDLDESEQIKYIKELLLK